MDITPARRKFTKSILTRRSSEGSAFEFGGCYLASAAVDHADALVAAAPAAEINVAVAAFSVVRAGGIVAEALLDG